MSILRGLRLARRSCRGLSSWAQIRSLRLSDAPLDIHPEVEDALIHNKPVVALETALVTHGLPYPASLEVPLSLESIVRSTGSIPATIGLIEGRVKVGLERHEVERLVDRKVKPAKISRRDIAAAIAMEKDGGTTCSATLIFAALAGIKVFATGGLGGVHRGGENSLDISADLHELTRCPVGLVSSGVKSILDIGRTLEYLETLGVPVLAYGDSREFPAFFSRHSGHNAPWNVDDPLTAAKILYSQAQLGMQNGALIAVPIPEEYESEGEEIQRIVNQAVQESEENGINKAGNDATPWLLNRIAELSGGKSLVSNIALLKNAALVGGQIAVQYQKLVNEGFHDSSDKTISKQRSKTRTFAPSHVSEQADFVHPPSANVVVVGSSAIDITAQELPNESAALAVHSTAPGHVKLSLGGVGRNIAEASHRVMKSKYSDLSSILVSAIGRDSLGRILYEKLTDFGMRTDGLLQTDAPTAVCNMVLDSKGTLVGGVADMGITKKLTGDLIIPQLQKHVPSIVALDGNLPTPTIEAIVRYCNKHAIKVLFEPTSTLKSTTILPAVAANLDGKSSKQAPIAYCTPNLLELGQLFETARSEPLRLMDHDAWWSVIDSLNLGADFNRDIEHLARRPVSDDTPSKQKMSFLIEDGVIQQAIHLLPFFQHLVIKCGDLGVLVVMRISPEDAGNSPWAKARSHPAGRQVVAIGKSGEIIVVQHFPSHHVEVVSNVTGAGDSFVGALLASLAHDPKTLYHPGTLKETISTAQKAAAWTIQDDAAVAPSLSKIGQI